MKKYLKIKLKIEENSMKLSTWNEYLSYNGSHNSIEDVILGAIWKNPIERIKGLIF